MYPSAVHNLCGQLICPAVGYVCHAVRAPGVKMDAALAQTAPTASRPCRCRPSGEPLTRPGVWSTATYIEDVAREEMAEPAKAAMSAAATTSRSPELVPARAVR